MELMVEQTEYESDTTRAEKCGKSDSNTLVRNQDSYLFLYPRGNKYKKEQNRLNSKRKTGDHISEKTPCFVHFGIDLRLTIKGRRKFRGHPYLFSANPENTVIPKHFRQLSHAPNRLSMLKKYELSLPGYGTRNRSGKI